MRIPAATYRFQFTSDFDFASAQAIVPYLAELGISDLYASPILTATTGSTHGYDAVDPTQINPELGGQEGFEALAEVLKQHKLGWLQDIVPNHMAFNSQNPMLVDVLENGPDSQYHNFFDIDWDHPYEALRGRLLAPFLGKFYGDCLESGELQLEYGQAGLTVNYYDMKFPIRIESYTQVLSYDLARLRKKLGRNHPDFVKLLGVLYMLKYIPSGEEGRERYDQIIFIKGMLWELWNDSPDVKQYLDENIKVFNGAPGNAESFNQLDNLLQEQFFRLSYWKVGNEELNYRRFFTVNGLISLRVEEQSVFDIVHELTLKLLKEEKITGLRIDHIDGLYDPSQYLKRLRESAGDAYITVEKILEPAEQLPLHWPIQGTTGYDFLNQVNGLFCAQGNEDEYTSVYHRFIGKPVSCDRLIDENKRLILGKHLAGDIDNLAHLLKQLSSRYRYASDFTMFGLKRALVEILAVFPIYRTYINREGSSKIDRSYIRKVLDKAKKSIPNFLNELYFIEKFLLLDFDQPITEEDKDQWIHFIMRLQQFTGPLMAKGVEDTVLYVYNRLISINEVGSSPCDFGISVDEFHAFNQEKATQWPHSMNTTSTHDTKRGEDTRARINVLSEMPQEWETCLKEWRDINASYKQVVEGQDAPDPNDEYFLYQTLIGSAPFDDEEFPSFVDRVKDYIIKAIREAKVHTGWIRPDTSYEEAFTQFTEQLLKDPENNPFWQSFRPFQQKIQQYGICNSLSQVLIKLASPGVPDFYQGTEFWDLSMVDPDNRRPVDYELRSQVLQEIKQRSQDDILGLIKDLLQTPEDGRIKLFLTQRGLQVRQAHLDLFQRGDYQKLLISGSLRDHVVAFSRTLGDRKVIAIAPRLVTSLVQPGEYPMGEQVWYETRIPLAQGDAHSWQDAITGENVGVTDTIWIRDALKHFPVALLIGNSTTEQVETESPD
ncbi:malto-oligosyltrehalose synthase [Oculatella sp. LEGE 06141]|nr:malto-oligosyltrehalose synthase [Oculatella sp. LEGE 06141]